MILEDQKGRVYQGTIIMRDPQEIDPLIVLQEKEGISTESIRDTTRENRAEAETTEVIMLVDLEAGVSLSQVMRGGIGTVEAED
jgi:hypothetical protein